MESEPTPEREPAQEPPSGPDSGPGAAVPAPGDELGPGDELDLEKGFDLVLDPSDPADRARLAELGLDPADFTDDLSAPDDGVIIWAEGSLTVRAALDEGTLVITGRDLNPQELFGDDVTEYEYGITVAPADVPTVLDALDVAEGVGVLDALVLRGADLVKIGEAGWLESIGVNAEFWSRIE